jgi:2-polyprenyl-6-methoxyphenol hydroxylase-like FAD-dependent oxidoreductase
MSISLPKISAEVLVLGAGPGGAAAALHLDRLGVPAVVLEARSALATRPNVIDLAPDAVSSLRRAGVDSVFDGRMGQSSRGTAGASLGLRVLEHAEREQLMARGVPVHYGVRATGIEQAGVGATHIRLADGRVAEGRFVINATGGRSGIEDALGMGLRFQDDWSWFGAARTGHVPQLPSGERLGGLLGTVRNDKPDRFGDLRPSFDPLPMAPGTERWRSTLWYGWQNPTDGFSMFQPINSRDFGELTPAELGDRLLAPARMHGAVDVLDAPRLIRAASADVAHARVGNVMALGDAAGRAHPKQMIGTQLAVLDAERAAETIAAVRAQPARAEELLAGYDDATPAAHAEFGHDGSKTMAADPFGGLGVDVLELDGLSSWPGGAAVA